MPDPLATSPTSPSTPVAPPAPATPAPPGPAVIVVPHPRPPRVGDLSTGWRATTTAAWIAVILAIAAVWNASVQLGLSTWWLGPRSDPQPLIVQFAPFVTPVLMLLAAVNQIRWLPWFGLGAAASVGAVAVGDLGRITSLAIVEFLIAGAAAAVSLASLSGLYRRIGP